MTSDGPGWRCASSIAFTVCAGEARFRMVELRSPQRYRELQEAARDAVRQRQALYEQLARIHLPPEQHHG